MNANDDRDLRARFTALRDEDAAGAPALLGVLRGREAGTPVRPARWIPIAAIVTAAALTAVALVLKPREAGPTIEEAIAQATSISSWTAPTDEWLTLSGLEFPDTVPSLSLSSVTLPDEESVTTTQGEAR